jgi:hypothetical protein
VSRLSRSPSLAAPKRLAARLRPGAAPSPLVIALLAAIALHLLALSALQLRQRRQPAAAMPPPRDDTPELLQFSRHQTREPAIAPLSLASLAQLPPPPPPPLTPTTGSAAPGAPPPRGPLARSGDLNPSQPAAGRRNRPQASAAGSAGRNRTPQRTAAGGSRRDPGLEAALAALLRWQSTPEGRSSGGGESGWPAPQKPEAEQLALWKRLWEKASPSGGAPGAQRSLPAGVELRRLPASDSDGAALPEGRRLSLVLGERLLLVWSAGQELWLLQAPAERPETDGDPQGA